MNQISPHSCRVGMFAVGLLVGGVLIALAGCVEELPTVTDGNAGLDPKLFPDKRIAGEPNDSFAEPVEAIFDSQGQAHLQGTIGSLNDVDVYALGPLFAGDRIIVDVGTPYSELDATLAIFDEAGRITLENDDRQLALSQFDPFLNNIIRHDSPTYFLAIAKAPLDTSNIIGSYEVFITVVPDGQVPATAGQVVILDFDGGTLDIPDDQVYTVGPFDAGDIHPSYAGMTGTVRKQVASTVGENFEGLNLDVRVVPGDRFSSDDIYSFVLFGGRNPNAFGISQDIDPYNTNPRDGSIVFTGMFTPIRFGRILSATDLGIAIGNVATHEIGHILGLNHVANVLDLMDTTGEPATLLEDQEFLNSELDETIFPIGTQDSYLLLLETLGGTL